MSCSKYENGCSNPSSRCWTSLLVPKSIMISNIKVAYVRSLPCRIQNFDSNNYVCHICKSKGVLGFWLFGLSWFWELTMVCVVVWLSYMLDSAKAVKVAWKSDESTKKQFYKQLLPGLTFLNIFKVAHVLMDSHSGILKEDEKRVTLKVVSLVILAEVHCTRVMHSNAGGVKVGLTVDLLQGVSYSALTNVGNELLKIWEWMLKSFITLLD